MAAKRGGLGKGLDSLIPDNKLSKTTKKAEEVEKKPENAGPIMMKINDVEPNSTVVGVPGSVVRIDGERVDDLDQIHIPDPIMTAIKENQRKIEELEKILKEMQ